jgi:hypothetical protein
MGAGRLFSSVARRPPSSLSTSAHPLVLSRRCTFFERSTSQWDERNSVSPVLRMSIHPNQNKGFGDRTQRRILRNHQQHTWTMMALRQKCRKIRQHRALVVTDENAVFRSRPPQDCRIVEAIQARRLRGLKINGRLKAKRCRNDPPIQIVMRLIPDAQPRPVACRASRSLCHASGFRRLSGATLRRASSSPSTMLRSSRSV